MVDESETARSDLRRLPGDGLEAMEVLDAMAGGRASVHRWLEGPLESQLPAAGTTLAQLVAAPAAASLGAYAAPAMPRMPTVSVSPNMRLLMRGGGVLTAAALLNELHSAAERAQVLSAIGRFGLDPNAPADVVAARAYVWSKNILPYTWRYFWSGPGSADEIERVARAVMRFERDNPGTLGTAVNANNGAAWRALDAVVAEAMAGTAPAGPDVFYRKSSVSPALSASSARARTAAQISSGNQSWQAHHLLPFAVVANLPVAAQQAFVAAGWVMDSPENVIALPTNAATYLGPLNIPRRPIHSGSHPLYDSHVRAALVGVVALATTATTSTLRADIRAVEDHLRRELIRNLTLFHPKLR